MADHPGTTTEQTAGSITGTSSTSVQRNGWENGNLAPIAQANERIKQVRRLAEDISLIATNAMLVARRAGDRAVGFRVVARELRVTSDRMAAAMQGVSAIIYRIVQQAAYCRGVSQRVRTLQATAGMHERARAAIVATLDAGARRHQGCTCDVRAMVRQLEAAVQRTGRQSGNGIVIARAAAIEAAYGGDMQALLRHIARHFEASITELTALIRSLRQQLTEMAA